MEPKKLYICHPYSSPDLVIQEQRFESANREAAKFIDDGHIVFSPVSMSHPIAKYLGNANDSQFWVKQDLAFIEWADEVVVVCAPGWAHSKGIMAEVEYAGLRGKPVRYVGVSND